MLMVLNVFADYITLCWQLGVMIQTLLMEEKYLFMNLVKILAVGQRLKL